MLRIVSNEKGPAEGADWVKLAGLQLTSFDGDGKLALLMNEEIAGRWDDAYSHAQLVGEADLEETPLLTYAVGSALLAHAMPGPLRSQVTFQVPFDAAGTPLSGDEQALRDRRRAIELFERQAAFAADNGAAEAATLSSEMALWLRLRDPALYEAALETLRASMRDDALIVRRTPLALHFGLKLDLQAIERRIDERVALTGKGTADEALARLTLAMAKPTPAEAVEYFTAHRGQLHEFLDRPALLGIEIELLARSGQIDSARAVLAQAGAELEEPVRERSERVIAEAEGADPAAERRRLYEKTGALQDLASLVNFLEEGKAWRDLAPLAETLFEKTHALEDALRATRALTQSGDHGRLLAFLRKVPAIVAADDELQSLLAWTLYREGEFNEAWEVLRSLRLRRDHGNDRALFVNLAIASGQWDSLVEFTTGEWKQKDYRSAEELLRAGQLAQTVDAPHARDLIVAATQRAPEDPHILAPAYFHATKAGWENDRSVGNWLAVAAEKSGEDGPIKAVSMRELYELKPDWDRRETAIYQHLNKGQTTVSGAAFALNQSMVQNCLLRPLANMAEADARRRGLVFAFSGARPANIALEPKRIALDLTALFSLSLLGLLDTVIAYFDKVLIPDRLLVWLFQERQRASFHQPSRIKDAHYLKRLIADGSLKIFSPAGAANMALAQEVGLDLAALLEAAQRSVERAYVVRSAPVSRVGSVMEEEADLTQFEPCLRSCQAVVEALRLKGLLTSAEEQRATSYLKLHERRWPAEAPIANGAILYVDDLSTTFLRTTGVLGKLKAGGFTAFVTQSQSDEENRLLTFESFAEKQLAMIEEIRTTLSKAIEKSDIEIIGSAEEDSDEAALKAQLSFLTTDRSLDAFVIDDRFVNRWLAMNHPGRQTPILTSLDIVEQLASAGVITAQERQEHRTTLRRSGYTFVPVDEEEIATLLMQAPIDGERMIETAELRAIRESAQRLRLSKALQVPHEIAWLQHYTLSLVRAARATWKQSSDPKIAHARCEWLLGQLDTRGWASIVEPAQWAQFAQTSFAGILHALSFSPHVRSGVEDDPFQSWFDERVLTPIRETEPEIFQQVAEAAATVMRQAIGEAEAAA